MTANRVVWGCPLAASALFVGVTDLQRWESMHVREGEHRAAWQALLHPALLHHAASLLHPAAIVLPAVETLTA